MWYTDVGISADEYLRHHQLDVQKHLAELPVENAPLFHEVY